MFRLAENQHKTVAELLTGRPQALGNLELSLWRQYRRKFGLASDRTEAGIALAGFCTARAMGSKVKLKHLFPDFSPTNRGLSSSEFAAVCRTIPGVKVTTLPMPKKKRVG